jgi:YcxB-like protein
VVVAFASLTSLATIVLVRGTETTKVAVFGLVFSAFWFAYMLLGPRFYSRRQLRNNPVAQSPITLNASEQGLEIRSAHSEARVAWSAYVAWAEAKSVFVIMPQPRIYMAIPKRAFGAEQLREFREMLQSHIVKK